MLFMTRHPWQDAEDAYEAKVYCDDVEDTLEDTLEDKYDPTAEEIADMQREQRALLTKRQAAAAQKPLIVES